MKLVINKNSATILGLMVRGAEVQNLKTEESDNDYYCVFMYDNPNSTLFDYPTDIQKNNGKLYNELVEQLNERGVEVEGDVVFKEFRSLLLQRVSTEAYDYFTVHEEFVLYQNNAWELVRAVFPLMYDHNGLLNHLWRKVGSFSKKLPKDTARYMYYCEVYNQTFHNGYYSPFIEDDAIASDIRNVKLGGEPLHSTMSYKLSVELHHLNITTTDDETKASIFEFKNKLLALLFKVNLIKEPVRLQLPTTSSLFSQLSIDFYKFNTALVINFSTHPEDEYIFANFPCEELNNALRADSFGRYFKQNIENKYTVYKNGTLLTERG